MLCETTAANRREVHMQELIGGGAIVPITAAAYYGYGRDASFTSMRGHPVKAALIGLRRQGRRPRQRSRSELPCNIVTVNVLDLDLHAIFNGDINPRRVRRTRYTSTTPSGHDRRTRASKVFEKYQDLLADR